MAKILLNRLKKIVLTPKFYRLLPETPGVYIYFAKDKPIYVGKAINLKRRVSSYFSLRLQTKTAKMISEASEMAYIKVDSELEALLLEAKLIKYFQPQYNIIAKDDKHPLYIQITKERYPRVVTIRKPDLLKNPSKATFGPFPSSYNVRSVLKMVRGIFPYSDHKLGPRACLYSQIGLCNPCPNDLEKIDNSKLKDELRKTYLTNIRNIKSFLDGNMNKAKNNLIMQMRIYSSSQNFERAAEIRDKIKRIEYITSPKTPVENYIENPNLFEDLREKELRDFKKILGKFSVHTESLRRIECYDVAHLQGKSATASMVTFINAIPDKNFYRHFKINQKEGWDDYASMKELAQRRKKHLDDWGKPNLIIVDGGKGQLSVFLKEFEKEGIPVVGLAKKYETLVIPVYALGTIQIKEFKLPKGPALNMIERIRDEAHRFANVYHHKLFKRSLFEK